MERNEVSVFELLPARRFHSCFVTGFSFDFNHFEMVVMSHFRRAGVTNVTALVDLNMLSESLGRMTGNSDGLAKTYSLHGLKRRGVFHSKIMLFFGQSEGFLILGSGNLTFSGHGGNDEVWGAFHIESKDDPKFSLFVEAWKFIDGLKEEIGGVTKKRFEWAINESPWVGEIKKDIIADWVELDKSRSACFLTNMKESLSESLFRLIPKTTSVITIISPFFDSDARMIANLGDHYPHANIQVILQPETAFGPKSLPFSLQRRISFYDWDKIISNDSKNTKYLHGKIIQFLTPNEEYCLFGSANCTEAAFGRRDTAAKNEEACILLRSKSTNSPHSLGLNLEKSEISFEEVLKRQGTKSSVMDNASVHYQIHLTGADNYGSRIHIFGGNLLKATGQRIEMFGLWGQLLTEVISPMELTKEGNIQVQCEPHALSQVAYIQIFSKINGMPLSNRQILHDVFALAKCHPNSRFKKVEDLYESLSAGVGDIFDLFRHLDLQELLENEPPGELSQAHEGQRTVSDSTTKDDDISKEDGGRVHSVDEFKALAKHDTELDLLLSSVHQSGIIRAFELFQLIFDRNAKSVVSNVVDDEELDNPDESLGREDAADELEAASKSDIRSITRSKHSQLQNVVLKFFWKYCNILEKQIEKGDKGTLVDLSMFCLATRLLSQVVEMPLEIIDEDKKRHPILLLTGAAQEETHYSGLLISIIGLATRLFAVGINDGGDELLSERVKTFRKVALVHSIFCIATLPEEAFFEDGSRAKFWEDWVWSLYMNIRHTLDKDDIDLESFLTTHVSSQFGSTSISEKLTPEYVTTRIHKFNHWWSDFKGHEKWKNFKNDKNGARVFSELDKFCVIRRNQVDSNQDIRKVTIARPGFNFDEDMKDFLGRSLMIPPAKIFTVY